MRFHLKRCVKLIGFMLTFFILVLFVFRNPSGSSSQLNQIRVSVNKTRNTRSATTRSADVRGKHPSHELKPVSDDNETVNPAIWYNGIGHADDRIIRQLNYIPPSYKKSIEQLKFIFDTTDPGFFRGRDYFIENKCAVDRCYILDEKKSIKKADAVLWSPYTYKNAPKKRRTLGQIWIFNALESPLTTGPVSLLNNQFNYTATYRSDSTLVTPYGKFVSFTNISHHSNREKYVNFARGKTKKIAWFVSNCDAYNRRKQYAKQLDKYITVDIYGACGKLKCRRSEEEKCLQMLKKDYKFYLSFENSNCQYYITEKFFNLFLYDVLPIVMGARKKDYMAVAPPNAFIHVEDFASPKELADYLNKLDKNDDLYNQYFQWKGTGEFINTKLYCRLCALLHETTGTTTLYEELDSWWRGNATCTKNRWDQPKDWITSWKT